MHVLITTDTLSSVWSYTRELVAGLAARGTRVTLVSFGEIPSPSQTSWMDLLPNLEYLPTAFRLDWMEGADQDFKDCSAYLVALVKERKPDLLHFNHPCYGSLRVNAPRIVVAHGDLINWWKAVHGREPNETQWLRGYRQRVTDGLIGADVVVATTVWMLDSLRACYGPRDPQQFSRRNAIIYQGRNPVSFNPYGKKDNSILAIGRTLDASTQLGLLTEHSHGLPVSIVPSNAAFEAPRSPIRADVKLAINETAVSFRGQQTESQMRALFSRSSVYVATARYDPFGLTAVDAALSRCALVANDIPSFREVWGDAALYFRTNNAASLARTIQDLSKDLELCRTYANRAFQRAHACFTTKRMIDEYVGLYTWVAQENTQSLAA